MTKEELIARAEAMGLKVRENFMDDWVENMVVLAVGILIGGVLTKLFL